MPKEGSFEMCGVTEIYSPSNRNALAQHFFQTLESNVEQFLQPATCSALATNFRPFTNSLSYGIGNKQRSQLMTRSGFETGILDGTRCLWWCV